MTDVPMRDLEELLARLNSTLRLGDWAHSSLVLVTLPGDAERYSLVFPPGPGHHNGVDIPTGAPGRSAESMRDLLAFALLALSLTPHTETYTLRVTTWPDGHASITVQGDDKTGEGVTFDSNNESTPEESGVRPLLAEVMELIATRAEERAGSR